MIDKNVKTPIYIQIADEIRESVKNRTYLPGQSIPTERELTEQFGVSRMTLRQAISHLVQEGVLYRTRGKGAFVSRATIEKKIEIESFSEEMKKRGYEPSSRVLAFEKIKPDEEIRQKLQLEANENVFFLNRLRMADGEPMAIEYCYLPERFVPNIMKYNVSYCSLYALMKEEYHIELNFMKQIIKAISLGKAESEMLLGKTGGYALVSFRTMFNSDEKPVEYTETIYHPERYSFHVTIVNS